MKIATTIEITLSLQMEEVEERLESNFKGLDWEIEHTEELYTRQGNRVKIYVGVCASYSGVNLISFINHGGGHVPYYLKLEDLDSDQTQVTVVVTGSENVKGDWGDRNGNLAHLLVEMCESDCTNKTLLEKAREFLR
jgi:hypothetical protein